MKKTRQEQTETEKKTSVTSCSICLVHLLFEKASGLTETTAIKEVA